MVDWTNTHFRVFMRLIAPSALLYTDMQTTGAVLNNPDRALGFDPCEHPLALQLGGADEEKLVAAARLAQELGFDEINLNLGCPSDRVLAGRFGACLMAEPGRVAACIKALKSAVSIPVTAKTRIGIDHQDSYDYFAAFAKELINAGCDKLIVHARKAWLTGLNPKQNRSIPPLHYDYVYQIKREFPNLPIVINGNIGNLDEIKQHMPEVDGVMLGRLACQNPYALAHIHQYFYPETPVASRYEIFKTYLNYLEKKFSEGIPLSILLKPLFNFAHGLAGAKYWKEMLLKAQQCKQLTSLYEALDRLAEVEQQLPTEMA
ncbi:tRNA dihydrouridine(20/20a) synthase DusA [Legionella jordanis]|nr:tRNA dihydrouridine(20/20a) synthase DusA [Legionella jordanis]RMX03411.1 tRNA dihydrouridine(20/20a) synthase DusA [Legionella jordanis]RMX15864.1 tRNA dihydrouridine(20/20a) synthase DusA [Legionella jordanis]HAT8713358.1 tRNA dihydrouridine(20/20a) synthase DusA [Legionella jordanis]